MDFEITGANRFGAKLARVKLSKEEKRIIDSALDNVLRCAARDNEVLVAGSPIDNLTKTLLDPRYIRGTIIERVSAPYFDALSDAVHKNSYDITYDRAKVVGGLVFELSVAAKVLRGETTEITPQTPSEINLAVSQITIPDNIDGFA